MKQRPRFQLNRAVVVLRYKQPYVDWIRTAGPNPLADYSLAEANDDGEIFLIPSFDSAVDPVDGTEDAVKWVEKRWKMFFEHILEAWIVDESTWPQKRTLKMFREWFDVEYRSMVWDMGNEPFVIDEWVDDEEDETDISTLH
jgi:hypothetical protein